MVKLARAALVLAACHGGGHELKRDGASVVIVRDAMPADAADEPDAAKPDEPAEPVADPGKAILDLGAVSAWQAVVDRAQYLARRGQHGVAFGTLGGPADPPELTWLVDDTEGNGALAIRVMLGTASAQQGDRVALGGAWELDDKRRWYWKVDHLTPLAPAPPSDLKDPPAQPGHAIAMGNLPQGARSISLAKDGDAVYFTLVGKPPQIDGEGWPIADDLGKPVYALLNLPGERPSFGGQDFRTPDERWQLKRGQIYWVRIGKVRRHAPDRPATINARTAPVRVK
jgi:hypothetical protein